MALYKFLETKEFQIRNPLFRVATLADSTHTDSQDIGFFGQYYDGSNLNYTGLFRDASDAGTYKLFAGLKVLPVVTDTLGQINTEGTGYTLADLDVNNLHTLGDVVINGDLSVLGTVTETNEIILTLDNNIIVLNSSIFDRKEDSGFAVNRVLSNIITDEKKQSGTASDAGTDTSIVLQAAHGHGTSADFYKGWIMKLGGDLTGTFEVTASSAADPPTLTFDPAASAATTAATTYELHNKHLIGAIFDESTDFVSFIGFPRVNNSEIDISGNIGNGNIADFVDIKAATVHASTGIISDQAISITSGDLTITNGDLLVPAGNITISGELSIGTITSPILIDDNVIMVNSGPNTISADFGFVGKRITDNVGLDTPKISGVPVQSTYTSGSTSIKITNAATGLDYFKGWVIGNSVNSEYLVITASTYLLTTHTLYLDGGFTTGLSTSDTVKLYNKRVVGVIYHEDNKGCMALGMPREQELTIDLSAPVNGNIPEVIDFTANDLHAVGDCTVSNGSISVQTLSSTIDGITGELPTTTTNSKYELHTGVISGGVISINVIDNTKIDVTAGTALIVDYTTPTLITTQSLSWNTQTVTPTATGFAVWVAVYDNSGSTGFYFTTNPTPLDRRSKAFIGRIWSTVGSTAIQITNFAQYKQPAFALAQSFQDFTLGISSLNLEGNVFSAGTLLKLNKSSGKSYRYWTDPSNLGYESVHIDAAITNAPTYNYHLQNNVITITKTSMDFDNYDLGGVSTAVTAGHWTIQEVWYYPVSQVLGIIYGQTEYGTLDATFINLSREIKIRNLDLLQGAIFRCYVIARKGMTSLSDAFFISQSTLNAPMMNSGLNYQSVNKAFSFNDVGSADFTYVGGFYHSSATATTLTIGGTVTQTFGTSQVAYGGYAFCVSAGPSANALVLTVSGRSVSDDGGYVNGDTEVCVANTSLATLNTFHQTVKKWIGTITYTLTGSSGAYTFNYGLCNFAHSDKDFYVTSFESIGRAQTAGANFDIQLYHHRPAGWTYSASAFVPNGPTNIICSMLTDYGYSNTGSDEYFSYTKYNLFEKIYGTLEHGFIIKVTAAANNSFRYGTASVGIVV